MTNSRRKGIVGELEATEMWRRWFHECRRSFGQARNGYELPDLIGGIEKDFYVEVKRAKKFYPKQLRDMWDKLIKDHVKYLKLNGDATDQYEIMMFREDGNTEWTVWMHRETFEDMNVQCGCIEDATQITTVRWPDFAAALDEIYPIKEKT